MKKPSETSKKSRKKPIIAGFIIVLLVLAVVSGIYLFYEYQKQQQLKNNPNVAQEKENGEIIAKVGKLIKLPNETPSVATVSDITKLQNQTLFQNAQNGDKVLIFDKAKRAIVYRPSENLIIEIGNVVVAPESSQSAVSAESESVTIALYNGTGTAGYAKKIGDSLSAEFPNIEVASVQNAANNYEKTLVVDLTGQNTEFAESLAEELNGEMGKLPTKESRPSNTDILIILGN